MNEDDNHENSRPSETDSLKKESTVKTLLKSVNN